ncbi:MAG: hypothetical protein QME64_10090 [bacterium]|nr:hypothetical protein [bacterium]
MNNRSPVETVPTNQPVKINSGLKTAGESPLSIIQRISLTSPNFIFGLSLGFIAILWLVLLVTPFTNIQLMAQILAAYSSGMIVAFVLAFFMTLLAGILNAKYSPRVVDIVFSHWTIGYMFFFVASTVYALMSIKGNMIERDLRVGFGLLSTCFFLLIPYIVFIKEYLKPEQYLKQMAQRALAKMQENLIPGESLPDEINQIDYLVVSSQRLDDYDTYEKGLAELTNLAERIPNESAKLQIIQRMESVARSFIAKPHAPVIIIRFFHQLGETAIRDSRYAMVTELARAMTEIGEDAIKSHGSYTINEIIASFSKFGQKICTKKDWTTVTKHLLRNLANLGDQCLKRKMPVSCESIAQVLGKLGEWLGQSPDFEELTYETVNLLKSLAHTAKLAEYDEVRRTIVLALGNIGKVTTVQPGLKELTTYIISAWEQSAEGLEM